MNRMLLLPSFLVNGILKVEMSRGGEAMSKPYVFITRKIPEEMLTELKELADVKMWQEEETPVLREVLLQEAENAVALFTMITDKVDEELLARAKKLKLVANMAVGFDNIDVQAATGKNIVVCNTPDVLTNTTADLTFALLMATARRIVESAEFVKEGKWKNWGPLLLAGTDIYGKTIGIVGMGRIGQAVAKRAKGFDMQVLYHNRSRNEAVEEGLGAKYVSFNELVKEADFIVCLAPLTEETRDMFTYQVFQQMKRSAIFINVSRGGLVDEEGLAKALEDKLIAAAGLDVFRKEPIDAGHPLLRFKNVVALPHIGSASVETRLGMAKLASENIVAFLRGEKPKAVVNEELYQ